MRLISWNANCRFRDKYHLLDHFDVAVVQECEDPKQSSKKSYAAFADRSFWLGKIKHKGLGVFLGADTKAEIMLLPETTQEYFLPLQLSSGKQILAVWAMGASRVQDGYIAQIHDYLSTHEQYFDWSNLTIVGDFNSNVNGMANASYAIMVIWSKSWRTRGLQAFTITIIILSMDLKNIQHSTCTVS